MNTVNILVIGYDAKSWVQVINNRHTNWLVTAVDNVESAFEKNQQHIFEAILVLKDVASIDIVRMRKLMPVFNRDFVMIIESENDDNLLEEVDNAVAQFLSDNKPTMVYKDDSLKNAGLNINIQ